MSHTLKDNKSNKRDKLERRNRAAIRKEKHSFFYEEKKKPDKYIDYKNEYK